MYVNLMLGDCLERMQEIPDQSVDMVMCDLPYGTTQNKWDTIIPLNRLWAEYWRVCKGAVVLTAAQPFTSKLVASQYEKFKYDWVWKKQQGSGHLNAKKMPMKNKEDVLVFGLQMPLYNPQFTEGRPYTAASRGAKRVSGKALSTNYGNYDESVRPDNDGKRYPVQTLDFPTVDRHQSLHPTQKPVALMNYLIRTYTNPGDVVLDNCMGSGTTGVAALEAGRSFIGIERDEGYFAIAERRIRECETYKLFWG